MRGLRIALLVLVAPVLSAQQPAHLPQSPANEWRSFRGSLQHTGLSASKPPEAPKLLWQYDAGEIVESTAAIADGVVAGWGLGAVVFGVVSMLVCFRVIRRIEANPPTEAPRPGPPPSAQSPFSTGKAATLHE